MTEDINVTVENANPINVTIGNSTPVNVTVTSGAGDMQKSIYDPNSVLADAFDADNHVYSNSTSGLTATDTQSAIDELNTKIVAESIWDRSGTTVTLQNSGDDVSLTGDLALTGGQVSVTAVGGDIATFEGGNGGRLIIKNSVSNEAQIQSASGDDLVFLTNGANEALRIDTSQNVSLSGDLTLIGGNIDVTGNITVSGTVDGVDVAALQTDVDGFPDELKNLTTAEVDQLENIGTTTISATQWGYLGALDQSLATTDDVTFNDLTIDTIDISGNIMMENTQFIQWKNTSDTNDAKIFFNSSNELVFEAGTGQSFKFFDNNSSNLLMELTNSNLELGAYDLIIDTDTLFVDSSTDRVGINNASPLSSLHVGDGSTADSGVITVQTNNSSDSGIEYYLADRTTLRGWVKWDSNEDLLLKGDEIHFDTANQGDALTLDVNGVATFQNTLNVYGSAAQIDIFESDNSDKNWRVEVSSGDFSVVEVGVATQLFIEEGGNVGIGNTNPSELLEISGGQLKVNSDNSNVADFNYLSGADADLRMADNTTTSNDAIRRTGNDLIFLHHGNGNVGIGTTSPDQNLHISGSAPNFLLESTGGGAPALKIKNITTGDTLLEFVEDSTVQWRFRADNFNGSESDTLGIESNTSGNIVTFLQTGEVGIGETSPDEIFHVNAGNGNVVAKFESTDSLATIQMVDSSTTIANAMKRIGDDLSLVPDGGNLGVITESPNATLHVANNSDGTTPVANFDTASNTQPFYISRAGAISQALSIGVDDNTVYLRSLQDETSNGRFQFEAEEGTSTDNAYLFQTDSDDTDISALEIKGDGRVVIPNLSVGVAQDAVTISGGVMTISQGGGHYKVDTEASAGSDSLDTITAGNDGDVLVLRTNNSSRDVTINHNTGNIICDGSANVTLGTTNHVAMFIYNSSNSKWVMIGKAN